MSALRKIKLLVSLSDHYFSKQINILCLVSAEAGLLNFIPPESDSIYYEPKGGKRIITPIP
jgi:hypothetical protein